MREFSAEMTLDKSRERRHFLSLTLMTDWWKKVGWLTVIG